jgi:hypothetical protein
VKIYINRQPKYGPWGGGIKTVNKLSERLLMEGHSVVYKLQDDIDIIFCIDPRPNNFGEWYQHFIDYRNKNPKTKIIQRVGDLGTHSKPELTSLVKQTLEISNYMIFPSEWSKEWIGFSGDNSKIVHNAPMPIFYENRNQNCDISARPRIVTHHWSMNPKKGFHFYEFLQKHIDNTSEFDFSYIGRLPENVSIRNHTEPLGADVLSEHLPKNDIYVTASIEEAGANHVLEALAAGLPVVYHKAGGSIDDYCKNYGESFENFDQMLESIRRVISSYDNYKNRVLQYHRTNDDVISEYVKIIKRL